MAGAGGGVGGGAASAVTAAGALGRRGGRFHLLELPVGRPVDLVVGSRYYTSWYIGVLDRCFCRCCVIQAALTVVGVIGAHVACVP